ncbi:MAG: homoserine dehydrogenase [Candidatus Bipolaricaulis sp.]|nr:homoserine dehydrogenase [Candidatus Bipolaricaulis sp.]
MLRKTDTVMDVAVVGLGRVGRTFVKQLLDVNVRVRLVALADRRGYVVCPKGFAASVVERILSAKADGGAVSDVASAIPGALPVLRMAAAGTTFVDATAAAGMAPLWQCALDAGAGVVLANKLPLCEAHAASAALFAAPKLRYEATVGAGLPVLSTLRTLHLTGDSILRIDAAVSGTLGFIAGRVREGHRLSQAVSDAIDLGFAEPDPREDLFGRDVARKALILGRSAGWPLEEADLDVTPFVRGGGSFGASQFLARVAEEDAGVEAQFREAEHKGETLVYRASIRASGGAIGLASVPPMDPLAELRGGENRVAFFTRRCPDSPVSIAGPGAGPEVTAAGVLADLIDLAVRGERR